jgi:lipoate-protein ligase A
MYIIKSESNDAFFNLALEEYLINNYDDEFFIIAVNEPSIVIGVNQNTMDEINALYVKQNSVKVVRRLSGGGTVFQDQGNLNFSFIFHDKGEEITDFSRVTSIIVDFLKEKLNISSEFKGRNDILITDKKFSGHARLKINNKILHHGTLLFSLNKKSLTDALKVNPNKFKDSALHSFHERVTNITEHLKEVISMDKFKDLFLNYVRNCYPDAKLFELTHDDLEKINVLVKDKYSTWEWNYGVLPNYNLLKSCSSKTGNLDLFLNIEDNYIKEIRIFGDFFSQKNIPELEKLLTFAPYEIESIKNILSNTDLKKYLGGITNEEFSSCFFN